MAGPFETVIQKLNEFKFFDFVIPFLLTSVLMYALLRKSKMFADTKEGPALATVVSLSVALMVFAFPVLTGITFGVQLSAFFTQLVLVGLIFVMALVFASMFYPDFPKMLSERFMGPKQVYMFIALALALLVTSGLIGVFYQTPVDSESPQPLRDVILIIAGIMIFMVVIFIAAASMSGGEKK